MLRRSIKHAALHGLYRIANEAHSEWTSAHLESVIRVFSASPIAATRIAALRLLEALATGTSTGNVLRAVAVRDPAIAVLRAGAAHECVEVALGSSTVICRLVTQAAELDAGADENTACQAFESCCNTIVCYCYRAEEYATSGLHHFTLKRLLGQAIKLVSLYPR